jgi:hypothetical protein
LNVCDNCLTAAGDEVPNVGFMEPPDERELLELICTNQGADIADHVCLVTTGDQEDCDCLCRKR